MYYHTCIYVYEYIINWIQQIEYSLYFRLEDLYIARLEGHLDPFQLYPNVIFYFPDYLRTLFIFIYLLIYFWLCWVFVASVGFLQLRRAGAILHCSVWLLIVVASLVAEYGLQARRLQQLWHKGSVAVARGLQNEGSVIVAHGLSCSTACGIFRDQGPNLCPLHWQEDS